MRLMFWRHDAPDPWSVEAIRVRLDREREAADAERAKAARQVMANAPTELLPHGALPRWVREQSMSDSDRYDDPEVTQ